MDDKSIEALKRFLPGIHVQELPEDEPKDEGRFPCRWCHGTGYMTVTEDGYEKKKKCPHCATERKIAAIVHESGVRLEDYKRYTLDSFIVRDGVSAKMKDAAMAYLRERPKEKGVGFFGRSGTGKTHLCIAILMAMREEHRYWKYRREIQRIKNVMYKAPEEYDRLMNIAMEAKNLYIDDFLQGAISSGVIDKQDLQIMFDIIDTRYVNGLPTFFSSNATLAEINAASEPLASRIYSMTAPFVVEIRPDVATNRRYMQ